ncbi:MAG: hypothetical protein IPH18_08235 [Chitinophagaceae bacterium]|nr:hypothetical protein [Chitinophagaceae bacterium]
MFDFARKYYTYDAIEPNTSKALELLEKAARADYMPAIKELVDIYSGESASYRSKDKFAADKEKQAYWAGVICKKDKTLAIAERRFERTYFQIYWGHFYYHLNHWYHENGSIKWTNQPFILLNELTPDKEKFYTWVNDEIKRESAAGNYYSVRVSNYTLQPLTIINDSNMTFNVVAYHYGKLPESLEFSISRFDKSVKEENNQRITTSSRNALVCTFDKDDEKYKGMMSKRTCNNGSLAYVFKNEKFAAEYFFNLTPVNKPEMKVYENWNRKGFDLLVDYDSNVLWAIFIKR